MFGNPIAKRPGEVWLHLTGPDQPTLMGAYDGC